MAEENKNEETKAEETKPEEAKPAEEAKPEAEAKAAGPKADPAKFADLIAQVEKLTVMELAELVKALEEKFGISAAAPAAAGGAAGAAEEEKTSFNVMLKASGDQKLNVIKAVREVTELGLKEAKDLVDGAPKMVKEGVKKEEAEEMKKKLEAAGATVEIQ